MIEVGARSGKKRADVLHDLGRLLFDGGAYNLARGGIEGDLTRGEQHSVDDDALGIRADGCRCVFGANRLHSFSSLCSYSA